MAVAKKRTSNLVGPKDPAEWIVWFVAEVKRLKRFAEAARHAFIDHLRTSELREDAWRTVAVTYDDFLKTHDIIEPARYRKEVRSLELVGLSTAGQIGMIATVRAARIDDDVVRDAVVAEMRAKAIELHAPLSQQGAKYIVSRFVPPKRREPPNEHIARLERENRSLRKQLAERDKIISDLRERLGETEA